MPLYSAIYVHCELYVASLRHASGAYNVVKWMHLFDHQVVHVDAMVQC
jgi:hypothetical protein